MSLGSTTYGHNHIWVCNLTANVCILCRAIYPGDKENEENPLNML
jgi:hypothetical protein